MLDAKDTAEVAESAEARRFLLCSDEAGQADDGFLPILRS